jgi:replicative DNA helicase
MLPRYAAEIAEAGLTRRLRVALSELAGSQLEGEELLEAAVREVSVAGQKRADVGKPMVEWVTTAVKRLGEQVDRRNRGESAGLGLLTGLADLDHLTGGLRPGAVTILGGRPSMGKSSLARCIAERVACEVGVHYFSHEDAGESLALRAVGARAELPVHRLMSLDIRGRDMGALLGASGEYASLRWWVDDSAGLSSEQISLRVRRRKRQLETGLVVVDYVQLLRERRAKDRRQEVEQAAGGLVRLARDEGVAVLLLSQLSRASEQAGGDRRPQLWHLRETGALEQVADSVWLVHRDEKQRGVLEVLVRKNKHGPCGKVDLAWRGEYTAVASLVNAPSGSGHYTDRYDDREEGVI